MDSLVARLDRPHHLPVLATDARPVPVQLRGSSALRAGAEASWPHLVLQTALLEHSLALGDVLCHWKYGRIRSQPTGGVREDGVRTTNLSDAPASSANQSAGA